MSYWVLCWNYATDSCETGTVISDTSNYIYRRSSIIRDRCPLRWLLACTVSCYHHVRNTLMEQMYFRGPFSPLFTFAQNICGFVSSWRPETGFRKKQFDFRNNMLTRHIKFAFVSLFLNIKISKRVELSLSISI